MACVLCLENLSNINYFGIFEEEGILLNIGSIIAEHFWLKVSTLLTERQDELFIYYNFQPNEGLRVGQKICFGCWQSLRDFHTFYQRVAEIHQHYSDTKPIELDDDPLPHDDDLLMKEQAAVASAGQLVKALGDEFFDSGNYFVIFG